MDEGQKPKTASGPNAETASGTNPLKTLALIVYNHQLYLAPHMGRFVGITTPHGVSVLYFFGVLTAVQDG